MKKLKNILLILIILICITNVSYAHGGNITGWKDKNSNKILKCNGTYYGYHKEDGKRHYHQVKWDDENKKWVIIAPAIYYDENFNRIENDYEENTKKIEVGLVETVDGDTAKFIIDGEQATVRFLGINTKETVAPERGEEAWGKEGSDFTKEKLQNATKIELEFDNNADEKDKYGRYLAWVWVDNELLQNLLVTNGLAECYMLQNNYKYAGLLQQSEEIAKNNKLAIWSGETNNIQNNKNEVTDCTKTNIDKNELLYMIIGIIIVLLMSKFSITHKKKKRK